MAALDSSVFASQDVARLLELAVAEDLGREGDVTSRVVPAEATCEGLVVFREPGVVAGLPAAAQVLARVAPEASWEPRSADGSRAETGAIVAVIRGPARGVLAAERTLLNFVQRLSGIATATRRFVDAKGDAPLQVLDTRKTTPGWRLLEKYAVRAGGGHNHRFGLYDQVLLKDNHLALLGGEAAAADVVARARAAAPAGTPVEVEVTGLDGALAAARAGADIVLLDNLAPARMAEVVAAVRRDAAERGAAPPLLEASGGIHPETIAEVAATGVDRASTGWITHSARALDVALDFRPERTP